MGYEQEYKYSKMQEDAAPQTYKINDEYSFTTVPKETSNFDVFRLCNPHVSEERCKSIWEYYRSEFLVHKLSGEGLSSFRKTLQRFIQEKSYNGKNDWDYNWAGEENNSDRNRHDDIKGYIAIARWLELQFNVDTTIQQLNENWTKEKLQKDAERILGTVPFNNYISYFSNNIHDKLKDPNDYDTRKLKIKNVFAYTHKEIRWYICASEYGAVKVWCHTKHSAFIPMFEKMVNNGTTINVVTSKILHNIDESIPYIKIENFFLDP